MSSPTLSFKIDCWDPSYWESKTKAGPRLMAQLRAFGHWARGQSGKSLFTTCSLCWAKPNLLRKENPFLSILIGIIRPLLALESESKKGERIDLLHLHLDLVNSWGCNWLRYLGPTPKKINLHFFFTILKYKQAKPFKKEKMRTFAFEKYFIKVDSGMGASSQF